MGESAPARDLLPDDCSRQATPYDIYGLGVVFLLNLVMDTYLILANPQYALPLFGQRFDGILGWAVKFQSPIMHGLLGYGFLTRRRWGYVLYMVYAAFGLASATVNFAVFGYGRIRMIFIVSLVLITAYVYARRRVFV